MPSLALFDENMRIEILPALSDNYIFIGFLNPKEVFCVDPSEASVVENFVRQNNLTLKYILNTHHHLDHTGGNIRLKRYFNCPVIASTYDAHRIQGIDRQVSEGDAIDLDGVRFDVLFIPGHTSGHIAFYCARAGVLFVGDTLFAMGCGRLFEGTASQMLASLAKIQRLPDLTQIYCGHEYTQKNAHFALTIDPYNKDLLRRLELVNATRVQGKPTIPFTLEEERKTNPYLRVAHREIRQGLNLNHARDEEVLAEIRRRRDQY